MSEITQERKINGNLYFIYYKAQILTKGNDLPQIMHTLEPIPLYNTRNAKKVIHITTQIFSQENKEITYTTLAIPKINEKSCIF